MKKTIITALTLTVITLSQARDSQGQNISVGIKGGLNSTEATLPLHTSVERGRAKGFHVGALVGIRINSMVELQVEGLYTLKGFAGRQRTGNLSYELEGAYLEIPILAKVHAPWSGPGGASPYLFAGPTIAVELDCGIRGKAGPEYLYYRCDGPPVNFDQRKRLDYGVMLGVGAEVPAGPGHFLVDLAYDFGIRDLADSPDIPGAVRHDAFMVSVGFATGRGR
jgi:hypothetical protein